MQVTLYIAAFSLVSGTICTHINLQEYENDTWDTCNILCIAFWPRATRQAQDKVVRGVSYEIEGLDCVRTTLVSDTY